MRLLLNEKEHLNCYLYDNQNKLIDIDFHRAKGETLFLNTVYDQIVFLLKGKVCISYKSQDNEIFHEGTFRMIPKGKCRVDVLEETNAVIINMHREIIFCNHFLLEMLYELSENIEVESFGYPLKTNEVIANYLDSVVDSIFEGLECTHFQELKQKELLFYLRVYYPKKDLAAFFGPILNSDIRFAKLIYENYESIKNIEELAVLTHYSIPGFKKRFVKVFGIPPHCWIEKEKAKKIYYEINCTQKTFKEIAVEYDFSSASYFNSFCKKVYGMSPGMLREKTKQRVLLS